jgi:tetratricopeptide (TPR) repeat protein
MSLAAICACRDSLDFLQGAYLTGAGKFSDALPLLDKAIKQKKNLAESLATKGRCLYELRRFDEALSDLNQALTVDRKNVTACRFKMLLHARRKQFKEALADCDALIALIPHDMESWGNKARIYHILGDTELERKANLNSPAFWEQNSATYRRADLYDKSDQIGPAIASISKYIQERPLDARGFWLRAKEYQAFGQPEKALQDLKRAEQLAPDDYNISRSQAQILTHLGRYKEAAQKWTEAIPKWPGTDEPYVGRAEANCKLHLYDEAIKDYNCVLVWHPDYEEVLRYRAAAHMAAGNFQKAVDDYTRGIGLDATSSQLYAARSKALEKLGKHEQSLQDQQKAKQLMEARD